jgi:putative oxidoreductase
MGALGLSFARTLNTVGRQMMKAPGKERLAFPFVAPLYEALRPMYYPLVRISLGGILIPHGYDKLFLGGAANTARNPLLKIFGDPLVGAYFIGCIEFFCGILLVLGLLTRFAAGAIAIQMFVISFFILWPVWGWTQRGMEFAIFMMLIAIAIFIRGGGNFSLDSKLPKEL